VLLAVLAAQQQPQQQELPAVCQQRVWAAMGSQ
jgi:hypothetical protein